MSGPASCRSDSPKRRKNSKEFGPFEGLSNEEQTWAYVLDFLSPLSVVKGCWVLSQEHHTYAVASLRTRYGWRPSFDDDGTAGYNGSATIQEETNNIVVVVGGHSGVSASMLRLLLGPRVGLRPSALTMGHGSYAVDTSNHSNNKNRLARQKQVDFECVLNKLGQSGALQKLRSFDASGAGAVVSFDWAARFMRYLKHNTPVVEDIMSAQPIQISNMNCSVKEGHKKADSRYFHRVAYVAAGMAIKSGVLRLPPALVGDWINAEHAGFEPHEHHRYTRMGHYIFTTPSGEARPTGTVSTIEPMEPPWPGVPVQTCCGMRVRNLGGNRWISQWCKCDYIGDNFESDGSAADSDAHEAISHLPPWDSEVLAESETAAKSLADEQPFMRTVVGVCLRFLWDVDSDDDGNSSNASTEVPQSLPTVMHAILSVDYVSLDEWETYSRPLDQLLADPDIQGDAGALAQPGPGGNFSDVAARVLSNHDAMLGYWRRKQPTQLD